MLNKPRRHGDIVLEEIPSSEAAKLQIPTSMETVLAYGEVTGHAHRLSGNASVALLERPPAEGGTLSVVRAAKGARLSHEEHTTFVLPEGIFAFTPKRQYSDNAQGWDRVMD